MLALLLVGFVAACAALNQSEAMSTDDKSAIVEQAKKDLAQRLNVGTESIELLGQVEEVTWPDTSLGCPEPGMVYAQVLTPGYRFRLQSSGKIYQYHAAKDVVRLCQP